MSDFLDGVEEALRPPPRLSLSEWADRYMWLSAESSAEPGRWKTLPYQVGVMNAITDPAVERITWMKSARCGYTKCINAAIGYFIHQDPCPILLAQPTVEDAKGYSKEEIGPMIRDVEVLARAVGSASSFNAEQTMLTKVFPGGVLSMVGANSGRGFRRVSRRVVIFDEVDGYPPSAGAEGDQIELGIRRTSYYANRKIIAGSTPLIAGASRIEEMFLAGDQRRYYVPCPHCGFMDFLAFRDRQDKRGHVMRWPDGKPDLACFECRGSGCVIEHKDKRRMVELGEWRADGEFTGHASFHIWSAYSLGPNTRWGQIAAEFVAAKRGGPEKLRTFVNTTLGETWHERGEAPDWERLYERREQYQIGTVPAGVLVVTAGVDVQKDRFVVEVVGWDADKRSCSVEALELHGDTALDSSWNQLDELLTRAFPGADGRVFTIAKLAIDSGYNTQMAYAWARAKGMALVMACKGVAGPRAIVGAAVPVDVTVRGRKIQRGHRMWPIGVDVAKGELYGWLGLPRGDGEDPPPGWCRFPEYGEDFFKQLTAEHLVTIVNRRTRRSTHEWQVLPNRENHYLDARILARAAAAVLGIDRLPRGDRAPAPPRPAAEAPAAPASRPAELEQPRQAGGGLPRSSSWIRPRGSLRPGGWLGRKR